MWQDRHQPRAQYVFGRLWWAGLNACGEKRGNLWTVVRFCQGRTSLLTKSVEETCHLPRESAFFVGVESWSTQSQRIHYATPRPLTHDKAGIQRNENNDHYQQLGCAYVRLRMRARGTDLVLFRRKLRKTGLLLEDVQTSRYVFWFWSREFVVANKETQSKKEIVLTAIASSHGSSDSDFHDHDYTVWSLTIFLKELAVNQGNSRSERYQQMYTSQKLIL